MPPFLFMDEQQQVDRLRALWKSGRDKYRSFFAVLEEVRREIGDGALDRWCVTNLLIGTSALIRVGKVLNKADHDLVRGALLRANLLERERRRLEKEARAQALAAAKLEKKRQRLAQAEAKAHARHLKAVRKVQARLAREAAQRDKEAQLAARRAAQLAKLDRKLDHARQLADRRERIAAEEARSPAPPRPSRIRLRDRPRLGRD